MSNRPENIEECQDWCLPGTMDKVELCGGKHAIYSNYGRPVWVVYAPASDRVILTTSSRSMAEKYLTEVGYEPFCE